MSSKFKKKHKIKKIIRELETKDLSEKNVNTNNTELPESTHHYNFFPIILICLIIIMIGVVSSSILYTLGYFDDSKRFQDVEIELGNKMVTLKDFLINENDISNSKLITDINTIDNFKAGTYDIILNYQNKEETVKLTIVDTVAPTLELKDVTILKGKQEVTKEDFIVAVSDLSNEVTTNLETVIDYNLVGTQTIEISAKDPSGNETKKQANLIITADTTKPVFSGIKSLTVKKNANVDYKKGITATDDTDGKIDYTVDTSKVDLSKVGTYYATYIAKDSSGNTTSVKRKITVEHNADDTKELVKQIAAKLSNDPEELRDYCRKNIKYSHNDGGSDPVWYGLKNKSGSCIVHAQCFKALLDAKGIENQLIWVTDKTHYWNLVKINGQWRHMDSTPSPNYHEKYSIMTDEQRLSTLKGRKWDTSLWPACN